MFRKFINQEYVKWRGAATRWDKTVKEFAEDIGVSQSEMSLWMDGKRTPRQKSIVRLLVNKFGLEAIKAIYTEKSNRQRLIALAEMLSENEALNVLPSAIREMRPDYVLEEFPPENKDIVSDEDQ
jgi:transcriptional regulator with XRE-family HTH domain